jgi:prevent-host-death family protein
MAVIHISETDAVRDFAAVLARVRAGDEVIIDSHSNPIAVLIPPAEQESQPGSEHDRWFRAQVQMALDDDRPSTDADEVEAHFARRRASASQKIAGSEG